MASTRRTSIASSTRSSRPRAGRKGTGLGLSVTYGIVREHGGVIEVDSQPGRRDAVPPGVPVGEESSACLRPKAPPPFVPKGKILVVDDEADIRESLEALLSTEGYAVDLAQNGGEGLRAVQARDYDLVLLDLMMPDRSGMEVLREIRERDRETPDLPDHRLRLDSGGGGGAEGRRHRLLPEALGEREAADRDRTDHRQAPAGVREHPAQARPQAALQLPQHRRQERAHGAHPGPGGAGGAQPLHHPDHGRNRHRQGTDRQGHPRQLAARRPDVHARQQRLAAAGTAGIDAVRPREGRLHRRHRLPQGLLRDRQPRHDLLRRDRAPSAWKRRPSCCA